MNRNVVQRPGGASEVVAMTCDRCGGFLLKHRSLPVIAMAEPRRVEPIWEAMRLGAFGYLFALFDPE